MRATQYPGSVGPQPCTAFPISLRVLLVGTRLMMKDCETLRTGTGALRCPQVLTLTTAELFHLYIDR